jgi:hypothetical protein
VAQGGVLLPVRVTVAAAPDPAATPEAVREALEAEAQALKN